MDVSDYDTAKMPVKVSMLSVVEFSRRAYAASYNEKSVGDGVRHTILFRLETLLGILATLCEERDLMS
jgi:hypothetical protein